jgi:uncharacterized protein
LTLYVDSSALLKRYFPEPDSESAVELLQSDPRLTTARHTSVEVRRVLFKGLRDAGLAAARKAFEEDWRSIVVIELSSAVCEKAAHIAESTGVRTLDALHLGAALEVGAGKVSILTYDARQARAARSLGWTVLGV